jgi:hypothetical protein
MKCTMLRKYGVELVTEALLMRSYYISAWWTNCPGFDLALELTQHTFCLIHIKLA